jgi:hypothetical protein
MQHPTPATLVRLHNHMRRDQVSRLALLADKLAKRKGRAVRLGEALEAALTAGFAWEDHDLLDLATPDKDCSPWLNMGPVHRRGSRPLMPPTLRAAALTTSYTGQARTDQ